MLSCLSFGDGAFRRKAPMEATGLAPFAASDITFEGVFGQYYFDTRNALRDEPGAGDPVDASGEPPLLWLRPSLAVSRSPVTGEANEWLALGLHSKYDGGGVRRYGRRPVQLVVVMDVSGSMGGRFSAGEGATAASKMEVAKAALVSMLGRLSDSDSLALVQFNHSAEVIWPLTAWKRTDAESVKAAVLGLRAGGSTDLAKGFVAGAQLLENDDDCLKRVLFFTDMRPNTGELSADGLFGMAQRYADKGVFSTFVGVGLDFGSELANHITTELRGAHYLTVSSAKEFAAVMDENFDYTVFPVVFDLGLRVAHGSIERVYGSREEGSGSLMRVKTLFPSAHDANGNAKGCVVLLKLKPLRSEALELELQFTSALTLESQSVSTTVAVAKAETGYYESPAVRKAVALTQYVELCQALLTDDSGFDDAIATLESFRVWFEKEIAECGDESMRKELKVVNDLLKWQKEKRKIADESKEDGGGEADAEESAALSSATDAGDSTATAGATLMGVPMASAATAKGPADAVTLMGVPSST